MLSKKEITEILEYEYSHTAIDFWECPCFQDFIHHVSTNVCSGCGAIYKKSNGELACDDLPNPLLKNINKEFNYHVYLTYDQFYKLYRPLEKDGTLLYIDDVPNKIPLRHCWTYLDNDFIVPGLHIVNKVASIITTIPWGHKDIEVAK